MRVAKLIQACSDPPARVCCHAEQNLSCGGNNRELFQMSLKVILSVYCVGEPHNPTPQHVALT